MSWYANWDSSFDLSRGGIELSFRNRQDMSLLLVETEPVRAVNRIIDNIETAHISPRQHIIGTRGFGKSTLLNYIAYRLFQMSGQTKVIPVYSSLLGIAVNEKELEFIFFRSLLESLFDVPSDIALFGLRKMFSEAFDRLTEAKMEYRKKLRDSGEVSKEYVYAAFENQLGHLSETFHKIVFLIDGLDKQDTEVVLKFFRNTQERLNTGIINKYNCVFIDAADPSWRETLATKEFSGVRGSPISLRVWTVDEVEALIKKRLEAIGIYLLPFDRKALEILVEDFQGNPREILQYATGLLHYSAKERLDKVGSGIARKIIWTGDSKEKFFNQIISNTNIRYAFEKLRTIYNERQIMNILVATYNQRGQRISRNLNYEARSSIGITLTDDGYQRSLTVLLSRGCLKISKAQNYLELENDMKILFDFISEMGQSLIALPAVLSELEFKVEHVAPPLNEKIAVKKEIHRVFEKHPSEWLGYKKCKELLLADPRIKKKLEERYREELEKVINATIPLAIKGLVDEGKLMQDQKSATYRRRPDYIDFETADFFQSKEILDLIELGEQAITDKNTQELCRLCEGIVWHAFSQIDAFFGGHNKSCNIRDVLTFLKSLKVNVSSPIPFKLFASLLEERKVDNDEMKLFLRAAILYAKRFVSKAYRLDSYEPRNQEIANKLRECKTGVSKEKDREHFREFFLPVLKKDYGKLVDSMNSLKRKDGILERIPPELASLQESGQILPAQLYECPTCAKRTIVSAPKIHIMNCPDDKVPMTLVKSAYTLSPEAYQAWNVWMEEYTREVLEQLPCKCIETGIMLKPIDAVGIASPEEVDIAVIFNGKSIAIECTEDIATNGKRNDVTNAIYKIESLALFDFLILIYRQVDNTQAFNAIVRKNQKFLFPIEIQSPKNFKTKLRETLEKIETP